MRICHTIDLRSEQFANLVRVTFGVIERFFHVDILFELSIKEGIINIKMMKMPTLDGGQSKGF